MKLYKIQGETCRYFLHEHFDGAGSWQEESVRRMVQKKGVMWIVGGQCQCGLVSDGGTRICPARELTGFMTNSICIARRLCKRCPNNGKTVVHRHVRLEFVRTRMAQIYPKQSCHQICLGIRERIEADRVGQFMLGSMDVHEDAATNELLNMRGEIQWRYKIVEDDEDDEVYEQAWDDVFGVALDPRDVKKARDTKISSTSGKCGCMTKLRS